MSIFKDNLDKPPLCILLKHMGGSADDWSYKTRKAPVKSSPTAYQLRKFLHGALKGISKGYHGLAHSKLTWGLPSLSPGYRG